MSTVHSVAEIWNCLAFFQDVSHSQFISCDMNYWKSQKSSATGVSAVLHMLANSLEKGRRVSLTFKKGVYERVTCQTVTQRIFFRNVTSVEN